MQETANIIIQSEKLPSDFKSSSSVYRPNLVSKWHSSMSSSLITSESTVSDTTTSSSDAVVENVSPYSKVDKTGFIGFFANFIEIAIDFGHNALNSIGVANSYGYSIIMFTILGIISKIYFCFQLDFNLSNCFFMFYYYHSKGSYFATNKIAARVNIENAKAYSTAAKDFSKIRQ